MAVLETKSNSKYLYFSYELLTIRNYENNYESKLYFFFV